MRIGGALLLLITGLAWSGLASAQVPAPVPGQVGQATVAGSAIAAQTLTDPELAALRGGFDLPGGMIVTLGVTTDTRVDGQEVLRTVFSVGDGPTQLAVLGRDGQSGVTPVAVRVDGAGVATADGTVSLRSAPGGVRAELAGDAVTINHLIGQSLGSIVVNSGNDRSIDVATTVDIGVRGVRPESVGSAASRIDTLALGSTALLGR